jgi:MarR family transcriptional regulator, transcriptional regulator for hemolysin
MTTMQDEESPGWNPRASASFWINLASRSLLRLQDARLHPLGFGMSQMPVLHALEDGASRSQKDLALFARVEQPTMAEMLARMERTDVIRRNPNPKDGRGSLISLTRRSRLRWPKAKVELLQAESEAMAGFSAAEREMLLSLLQRVVSNIEAHSDGSLNCVEKTTS